MQVRVSARATTSACDGASGGASADAGVAFNGWCSSVQIRVSAWDGASGGASAGVGDSASVVPPKADIGGLEELRDMDQGGWRICLVNNFVPVECLVGRERGTSTTPIVNLVLTVLFPYENSRSSLHHCSGFLST